jgi:hypothetical protein
MGCYCASFYSGSTSYNNSVFKIYVFVSEYNGNAKQV